MAGRTTQKSHETESSASISLSLLLGEDPGHLSQQPQATSSQDQEPLGSPSPSEVGSEYLPFFHIPEQPLAMEEPPQQVQLCPGHKAGRSCREGLFLEESAPPSGFFPYYRSQEELLNCTTPQGCWCLGTRDRFPGSGAQDGCCKPAATSWEGSCLMVTRIFPSLGTVLLMLQDLYHTTEALKRGFTPARCLPPLCWGARGSDPNLVLPACEDAAVKAAGTSGSELASWVRDKENWS
ncbi:uncharacterized protein LOC131910275 isoform X1 [Peromyscus eremicus]|uniref:uncharacterized protein LOC131910275 isoform X1 n=1 Tax=Peromyscus eremicus TaxID=42410 RepID=UPI0027DC5B63|nr:uncharacterized protein LOC131910275 isoform X1 [Peromyscus eremicus]